MASFGGVQRLNSAAFEMKRKSSFSKLHGSVPRVHYQVVGEPTGVVDSKERLYQLMDKHLATDTKTIQRSIVNHVEYTLAKNRFNVDEESFYRATAYSVRDRLIEMLNDSNATFFQKDVKRCYYLSLEFLMGRTMQNALVNLDIEDEYRKALGDLGYRLENLYEYEHDAALGNGGLGRLAACFLDSMATGNFPCWGYGIRYTYGIFEQKIINGYQVEHPDYWLVQDNPWEIVRHDVTYAVRLGGNVKEYRDEKGRTRCKWVNGHIVQALGYDNPIPGFDTFNCINLRLWRAMPSKEFDFDSFNSGMYLDSIKEKHDAEYITSVLYPNDSTTPGKELRLKQQYFFVCATIQDVLRRFKKFADATGQPRDWSLLPKKMVIQLNDTHPTIGIPELIRILVDVEGLDWQQAVNLTKQCFNYTNHTVLPEALEKWPADLIERLLPRHLAIINQLNHDFLQEVRAAWGDNYEKISRMSIYEEGWTKLIRMANLAVIGSTKVNGVAAIHSNLVKKMLFPDFAQFYQEKGQPNKFINVTNGVTPRRWIHNANRDLSALISTWTGNDTWLKELSLCEGLLNHIDDEDLLKEWREVKLNNKKRLCAWVKHHLPADRGAELDPSKMMFDIQVKRIHEYKRQHLNAFYLIHRYLTIKKMSAQERQSKVVPRASFVGGKAAPGYATAKTIIKLVNCVSSVVNNDPDVSPYFKVYFLPNYNVSSAQIIFPAADIHEQISTAGTEASGTGNMKFAMNGGLIMGTMDGANVEIVEEGGMDTAFIFGAREPEVAGIRSRAREGRYPIDGRLWEVFNYIRSGALTRGDESAKNQICELINRLVDNGNGHNGDFYLVCHDFPDFCRAQDAADQAYRDQTKWAKMSIKAAACCGKFSTDRTINDYAREIWDIKPCEVAGPQPEQLQRLNTSSERHAVSERNTEAGSTDVSPKRACPKDGAKGESAVKCDGSKGAAGDKCESPKAPKV